MEKKLAQAYEKALALVTGIPISVTFTNGAETTHSDLCHVDEGLPSLVYVANKKKDGGQWMVTISLRDLTGIFKRDLWMRHFQIIPEIRRKRQPETYRFMGAERVCLTPEQTVIVRFRTGSEPVTFELSPHTRKPLDAWASAAKSITEAETHDTVR